MFANSDEYNCPVSYYLINEWGRDLSSLLESGISTVVRINENGDLVIDEAQYDGLTFVF